MAEEKGYNLRDAAQALGIKVRTARAWVHEGKLRAQKIPNTNRWLVLESEINRLQGGQDDKARE